MAALSDSEKLGDDACATLRRGLRRGKQLTAEARERLSELTSNTVYPGLANVILTDANMADTDAGECAQPHGPASTAT